ncbi:unnamed protein product [Gongylonema pulchrum]|uniref:Uncharacterized protein n=1 Tax=Gongylonema pulchrum TaxID=637853 RepID=A0A183EHT9_9BILA|nr:unnamed protein product [Gongylonema pulchrum]
MRRKAAAAALVKMAGARKRVKLGELRAVEEERVEQVLCLGRVPLCMCVCMCVCVYVYVCVCVCMYGVTLCHHLFV